ncbi:MAG: pseudouridine synthase [Candidatus Eisenbacteria bacterium]
MSGVRLNKLLASRGIGARRACDALIEGGSVRVNGTVVREPGTKVDPEHDQVRVHGRPIPGAPRPLYYMLHKPVGVLTTLDDPEGRRTVREFLPSGPRLFPVGRLDADTSGLLLLTNDGGLAHKLMHPRYGVQKVYRVRLDFPPGADQVRRLREGVRIEPGVVTAPAEVKVRNARPGRSEIEIVLHEGRYRQVRRMCEAVGLEVRRLHRSAYGPLRLGPLQRGEARALTAFEVGRLREESARPGGARARIEATRRRLEKRAQGSTPEVPAIGDAMGWPVGPAFESPGPRRRTSRPGSRPLTRNARGLRAGESRGSSGRRGRVAGGRAGRGGDRVFAGGGRTRGGAGARAGVTGARTRGGAGARDRVSGGRMGGRTRGGMGQRPDRAGKGRARAPSRGRARPARAGGKPGPRGRGRFSR